MDRRGSNLLVSCEHHKYGALKHDDQHRASAQGARNAELEGELVPFRIKTDFYGLQAV